MFSIPQVLINGAISAPRSWFALGSTVFFGYLLARAVYDLLFHPLANCPGPFAARISKLPNFYHAVKGDRHLWIWKNHQIYGDKVRIHPNEVVFLSQQAYRDIYGPKANVRRSKSYEAWKIVDEGSTALTIDPVAHARKRRILNQAFTEKSVKNAATFVIKHTERWLDLLTDESDVAAETGWSKPRNMTDWNNWLVFDILGDMCFGRSFEIKEPAPNPIRAMPSLAVRHVEFIYPILQSPFMEFFVWAKPRGLNRLLELITPQEVKAYFQFINNSVSDRIRMEQESKELEQTRLDMFHYLCAAKDPITGEPYSEGTLQGEAFMLIVAGSDSTSSILSGFWFYISRNKAAYNRLITEIRTTFNTSDEILSGPQLASCVYLHACIDESLRISPAGPSEFAREVLPGGTTIDGDYYPQGVTVGCANWAMGHNDQIFREPNCFRPERYIPCEATGVSVEEVNRIKSYYHPFLIGPTNCVAKNIAITEMALIIARTLFRLELETVPGEDLGAGHPSLGWGRRSRDQYQISDAYVTVREGPILQFKKRSA